MILPVSCIMLKFPHHFPSTRGLLEDTSFHTACGRVFTEPIPYFQQYSDKGPTKRLQSAATSDTSFSVNLLSPKGSILSLAGTMAPFEEDPTSPSVDLPPTTADTQASAKSSSSHPRVGTRYHLHER